MKSTIAQSYPSRSPRNRTRIRRANQRRRLGSEQLESRVLLAGDTMAWHNAELPMDTNEDGRITALDALVVINDLNANGPRDVDASITPAGLVDVNADGVVAPVDSLQIINHLNSGAGEPFRVRFRMAVTPLDSEDTVATLEPDEEFLLRVYVTDLTENPGGVFAAYLDVTYNEGLADAVGPIEFSAAFPNGPSGDLSEDGVIDEAGSFASGFTGTGAAETLLLSIPMTTEGALGTLTFMGDPPDILPSHEVAVFAQNDPIALEDLEFLGTSVQITSGDVVTAVNDAFDATEDLQLIVPANGVFANDVNPGGVALTAVLISDASNGSVVLDADGSFTYQPNEHYFGPDSFTYAANDGAVNSNTATVSLTVAAVNDAPTATPKEYTTTASTPTSPSILQVLAENGLLQGASDVEGSDLTVNITETTANGVLTAIPSGAFTYVPEVGFTGADTFQFVVNDGELDSVPVTGTIQVTAGNDGPTANPDKYLGAEDIGVSFLAAGGVLLNDTDPNGDPLTAVLVTGPSNGTVTLEPNGAFNYVSNPGFLGVDSFTYSASDGITVSAPATVSITIQPTTVEGGRPPLAEFDEYQVVANNTLTVSAPGVLANDSDPDGDNLGATVLALPTNGTLDLNLDGSFEYTPNTDFIGTDTFVYTASDGLRLSIFATVTINVVEEGGRPTANPDKYLGAQDIGVSFLAPGGVLLNDTDPNGDPLTAQLVTGPSNGTVTLEPSGAFNYVSNPGFLGVDSFTYSASNGTTVSLPTTVSITIQQTTVDGLPPLVEFDEYEVVANNTLTVSAPGVLANDFDPDGDNMGATLLRLPENGTLDLNLDGSFEYTPDADFIGSDFFVYTASDGLRLSIFAVATINVVEQPDNRPVANDDNYDVQFETPLSVSAAAGVLANDFDPDGDPITAELFSGPPLNLPANGTVTLNADGSFVYVPDNGFIGVDSFTYIVRSQELTSQIATVRLNVQPPSTDDLVSIRVAATNTDGVELTTIDSGNTFELRVFVRDISPEPREGVFAAYTDVTWNAALAAVNGPILYSAAYQNGRVGNTSTPGLIDEAGAFDGDVFLGAAERLLFRVPMVAAGIGELTFTADPADNLPFGNVLLFDTLTNAVPQDQIAYGTTSLAVVGLTEPVAVNDDYDASSGMITVSAEEGVLSNDLRVDNSPLTAVLVDSTTNGSLTLNPDGSFSYTADAGFIGVDTFTYRAVSDTASSAPATVSIRVGNLDPSRISGFVYFDTNNNGVFEDHEHAFGGVEVQLSGSDLLGQDVLRTTQTARNGSYSFTDLLTGNYVLTQEQPAAVIDGIDSHNGVISPTNDSFSFTLTAGDDARGYNFGERGLQPAYFGNPFFFSSTLSQGASIAIGPDGTVSWYCLDDGWSSIRSARASLSADRSSVTITAIDTNGTAIAGTLSVNNNRNVIVLGNAETGFLVKLNGPVSQFGLQSIATASSAAVDAVFAE